MQTGIIKTTLAEYIISKNSFIKGIAVRCKLMYFFLFVFFFFFLRKTVFFTQNETMWSLEWKTIAL